MMKKRLKKWNKHMVVPTMGWGAHMAHRTDVKQGICWCITTYSMKARNSLSRLFGMASFGQWLANSISLLSHFPALFLICHPQVCQTKVWQKWQRTAPQKEMQHQSMKSTRIQFFPQNTHSLIAIACYWFHLSVLGNSKLQHARTRKKKNMKTEENKDGCWG